MKSISKQIATKQGPKQNLYFIQYQGENLAMNMSKSLSPPSHPYMVSI